MPHRVELDLALAGLALARNWLVGDRSTVERVLDELRRVAADPVDTWFDAPLRPAVEGYREWSATYDRPGNPILQLEEPAVAALLSAVEPGTALDAACGTGRHAASLARAGHRVIGVDASPAMLERARARVPDGEFRLGELVALPLPDASVDVTVCSLALTHVPDLEPAFAELARVVRPGGRVVVTDVHPVWVALGSQALYRGEDGRAGYIRNHVHWPSEYLRAIRSALLTVRGCQELFYGREELELWVSSLAISTDVAIEALEGLPAVIVWDLDR